METISHSIEIDASAEKIWEILWNPTTYTEWTKHFGSEGGKYESDWEIGGKTLFLDASGEHGMVSTIESLNPPFEVVFKHLGTYENGVETIKGKEIDEWSGAQEKYFLTVLADGTTKLQGDVQTMHDHAEHMKTGFEKCFELVKELSEK